jgi:hypothetical protein
MSRKRGEKAKEAINSPKHTPKYIKKPLTFSDTYDIIIAT